MDTHTKADSIDVGNHTFKSNDDEDGVDGGHSHALDKHHATEHSAGVSGRSGKRHGKKDGAAGEYDWDEDEEEGIVDHTLATYKDAGETDAISEHQSAAGGTEGGEAHQLAGDGAAANLNQGVEHR